MALKGKATADDVTYCKARLAFAETVLAALAELRLSLERALNDFNLGHPGQKPRRTRR